MKKILIAAVMSTLSINSIAQPYIGSSISNFNDEEAGRTISLNAISIHLGNTINSNFAIEGRLTKGISSYTEYYDDIPINIELDNAISLVGKLSPDFNAPVAPYAFLGFGRGQISVEVDLGYYGTYSDSTSDTGAVFGIGANLFLDQRISLTIEAGKFVDTNSVTVGFKFNL